MTSVTIPSSTGLLQHGGYPSTREQISNSTSNFQQSRNSKRCRNIPSASESSKKRRKQSTPIRIFNSEPGLTEAFSSNSSYLDGKTVESFDNIELRCPSCSLTFESEEQLDKHNICEHRHVKPKKELEDDLGTSTPSTSFEDSPLCLTLQKSDMQWTDELRNKDWLQNNLHTMSLNSTNPVFMAMSQYGQAENIQIKPIRIFNLDAYCGLCNKEFCNKYFLKTHKANKHGIYSDVSSNEQLPSSGNNPSYVSNVNLKPLGAVQSPEVTVKTDNKSISLLNPYSVAFPCGFTNKPKQSVPAYPDSEFNDVQNRVSTSTSNGPSSSSESDKVTAEDQMAEVCGSHSNVQTETTSIKNESDDNLLFYDSVKMSPSQSSRELDLTSRLRRIGVMNPKAFCEMCNKEYCNKYFLRTHKMKRHGIYIAEEKDQKSEGSNNHSWSFTTQTSPLNLIVTEQQQMSDRKTTSPSEISCDMCGIKFQNSSLAQLHNSTVHRRMSPKEFEGSLEAGTRLVQHSSEVSEEQMKNDERCITATPEKSLNPETISEDLQKLQTMILQLNDIDVSRVATNCNLCNKRFENRFFLHAHMVAEHGLLLEDTADFEKGADSENSNNNTLCDLCGKDFQNGEEMKKHILEIHSTATATPEGSKEECAGAELMTDKSTSKLFMPNSNVPERRLSVNVTPTSSYCEICNKELCNKYFMKTHMQRMHGIEIESGAQIGGVVCDICNKELCSKYFLRVHKHNTHGIVEYGASIIQPKKPEEAAPHPRTSTPEPEPMNPKPGDLADLSQRYFTHFTEVCPICSRRFRSTKWLKAHLISDHGQTGLEKWSELEQLHQSFGHNQKQSKPIKIERASPSPKTPNGSSDLASKSFGIQNVLSTVFDEINAKPYQCSFCTFSSPLLPMLFIHERTHSINENSPFKCPICPQSFLERDLFQRHLYNHQPVLPFHPSFNGHTDANQDQQTQDNSEDGHKEGATVEEEPDTPKKNSSKFELPLEVSQSLQNAARKAQLPATYALPQANRDLQNDENSSELPGYVMQAFLLEDSASDRRVVPSVVFLPMLQRQPAPLTVTFTLTPA
ncbi:zinc finger and BTB domain-containing protein 41 [Euwallacea similis]|uniref:zinc finger and BTB domain-containing protein 41 n=1 Tax=Euwallacea similis TaxID=1736056 RepID=UPI00344CF12C